MRLEGLEKQQRREGRGRGREDRTGMNRLISSSPQTLDPNTPHWESHVAGSWADGMRNRRRVAWQPIEQVGSSDSELIWIGLRACPGSLRTAQKASASQVMATT
ncbi:UNVERIFIED_CONTAM: hypothetical protein FKN15_039448 [Acipenser sinensis]